MKHLRETFTDQEFTELQKRKEDSGLNWHDFILAQKNLQISLTPQLLGLIEDWRKKQSPIPSQNTAINILLKAGLVAYQLQQGENKP